MALLKRCVRLLAGEERSIWAQDSEKLEWVAPRILYAFGRPQHQFKLLSDETKEVFEYMDEMPFLGGHISFTVVFWWESTWCHRLHGTLLAIENQPHEEGWPQVGVDKQYAGSFSYSSPYTRERWVYGYGPSLQEIMLNLLSEKSSSGGPRNLHDLERISKVACRISHQHARLTVSALKMMISIAQQAASCRNTPCERQALKSLELFLRGNGLKETPRRCRRKTKVASRAPMQSRVAIYNRVMKKAR